MSKPNSVLAAGALAACLSACASAGPQVQEDAASAPLAGSCNPDAAQSAVGKTATAEVVEQARKDAGAEIARTLKPGQVVTMEFREGRLNISVDDGNIVTGVRCG